MNRDDFPTLEHGEAGWPLFVIPQSKTPLTVEYYEDHEDGFDVLHVRTNGNRRVRVIVDALTTWESAAGLGKP